MDDDKGAVPFQHDLTMDDDLRLLNERELCI
jgi:hypothetical protein